MSEQFKAASLRAIIFGVITAALTFLTTLQITDFADPNRMEIAATAAGVALFSYLVSRAGLEGGYDTHRQNEGDIKPSDVGALPPTV